MGKVAHEKKKAYVVLKAAKLSPTKQLILHICNVYNL